KKVLGIVVKSGNMKWTYIKVLRDAAATITVGATMLNRRVAEGGGSIELLEEVRSENQRLRTSQGEMRREME
ncbi:hypothetical protein EAI_00009, partial [Harpegnathos saltator]